MTRMKIDNYLRIFHESHHKFMKQEFKRMNSFAFKFGLALEYTIPKLIIIACLVIITLLNNIIEDQLLLLLSTIALSLAVLLSLAIINLQEG